MRKRFVAAILAGAAPLGMLVPSARAGGGTTLSPVQDRYEVGETATVLGYASQSVSGDPDITDWSDTGRFIGYLRVDERVGEVDYPDRALHPTDIPLGTPVLTGVDPAVASWADVRVSLTFPVPAVPPGSYWIVFCNDPCWTGLGNVLETMITVGEDPPLHYVRVWPVEEPAIADLDPLALVWPPGWRFSAPAAEVRRRSTTAGMATAPRDAEDAKDAKDAEKPEKPETAEATVTTGGGGGHGDAIGPGLVALGVGAVVALWVVVVGRGPSRKRVTRMSATTVSNDRDLPCDPQTPTRH